MLSLSRKQLSYCRSTTASNLIRYTKYQNLQYLLTNKPSPSTTLRRYHAGYLHALDIQPVSYALPSCKAYSTTITKPDVPDRLPDQSISTSKKRDADEDEDEDEMKEEEEPKCKEARLFFGGLFAGLLMSTISAAVVYNPKLRAASSKAQKEAAFTHLVRSMNLTADEIHVAMLCKDVILDSIQTLTREKLAPFEQMRKDIEQKRKQKIGKFMKGRDIKDPVTGKRTVVLGW